MSAICQKVESSIVRWLASASSDTAIDAFALATHATSITIVNTGLHVALGYEEFDLNFYSGESETEVRLPSVVVVCQTGEEDDPGTGNYSCDVSVELSVTGDPGTVVTSSVLFLNGVTQWLHDMILETDVESEIEKWGSGLLVSGLTGRRVRRGVDGRRRIHYYDFTLFCAGLDFESVPAPTDTGVVLEVEEIYLELPSTNYARVSASGDDDNPRLTIVAAVPAGEHIYDAVFMRMADGSYAEMTAQGADDNPYLSLDAPVTAGTPAVSTLKFLLPSDNYLFARARGTTSAPYLRLALS